MSNPPSFRARSAAVLVLAALAALSSCATVAGTVSGALTGAVDAPRAIYRIDAEAVDASPELWLPIVLVFAPLGVALGPVMGMAKGVAVDVQAGIQDRYEYSEAFGTYGIHSVWRPYTFSHVVD